MSDFHCPLGKQNVSTSCNTSKRCVFEYPSVLALFFTSREAPAARGAHPL